MKTESLAHLAGLMGCIGQLDREELPPAMRYTFKFMENEILAIVQIEEDEKTFELLLKIGASIYAQVAPKVDKAVEGKSNDDIEDLVKRICESSKK